MNPYTAPRAALSDPPQVFDSRAAIREELRAGEKMALVPLRAIAYAFDFFVIVGAPIWMTKYIFHSAQMAGALLSLFIFIAVLPALEWRYGWTPGKYLMRLRVIDGLARRPAIWRVIVRRLVLPIDSAFFGVPGIIAIFITPCAQRGGDLLSGTYVVEKKQLPQIEVAKGMGR